MILETTNPEFDTIIETLVPKYGKIKVTVVHEDGSKTARRLGRAFDEAVMMYRVGSKRYGYYLEKRHFTSIIFPEKRATETDKWEHSWKTVLKYLENSGFWGEIAEDIRVALELGRDKIIQAYDINHEYNHDSNLSYQEERKLQAERIKAIDGRLVKYRDDGSFYPNSEILWHIRYPARVKTMYFGKYENKNKMEAIKIAMQSKTSITVFGRYNYDVHLEYNAEKGKAWWSEEYKNCGNGHYYLALDATHVLFYEDD
jgi:hypothetical protein